MADLISRKRLAVEEHSMTSMVVLREFPGTSGKSKSGMGGRSHMLI
jgi:hypothetical protein